MDNFDDKYRRKNPFTVPEGYFDELTDKVMNRLEKKEKPQKLRFIQLMKPYLGLAAIFILALVIVQALFPLLVNKDQLIQQGGTEQVARTQEPSDEDIFDSQFNPTNEEIIEYLASEVNNYELIYAGIY